jgi:hypothetical protein
MAIQNFPECLCVGFNPSCFEDTGTIITPSSSRTIIAIANFDVNGNTGNYSPFMTNITFTSPALTTSYDAFIFSGGATMSGLLVVPNAVGGTTTVTSYGTSATGVGVEAINIPTTASTTAVSFVAQPNFINPNLSSTWAGTITINWLASTFTITFTGTGSATLTTGGVININAPPFRCPSSLVIGTAVTAGVTYNFIKGSTDTSFFVNQTSPISAFAYGINSLKFSGTITITNGLATFTTTSGTLQENMYIITATATYLTDNPRTANSYTLVGIPTTFSAASQSCSGYLLFSGSDITYSNYLAGSLTPQAFLRGASLNNLSVAGGSGGYTTISASATNTTSMGSTTGNVGNVQTVPTSTFPAGIVNYTILPATNTNAGIYGGSDGVRTSADTAGRVVTTTSTDVIPVTTPKQKNGGLSIYYYK